MGMGVRTSTVGLCTLGVIMVIRRERIGELIFG